MRLFFLFLIQFQFLHFLPCQNIVPNPGFETITGPVTISGLLELAVPWRIDNQTPDLFHTEATLGFLRPPLVFPCTTVNPNSGNAFAGIATYGHSSREIFSTHFLRPMQQGVDYYVAMHVRPWGRCPFDVESTFCFTNGIGLNFITNRSEAIVVIEPEEIIDDISTWTLLQSCYTSQGNEFRVQIGNLKTDGETLADCIASSSLNFSYFFVDDIIVDPFDVVPDVLYLCKDSVIHFDIEFYNLDLMWEDDVFGGRRSIDEPGTYIIIADAGSCYLRDTVQIVGLMEDDLYRDTSICPGQKLTLETQLPVPGIWNTGITGQSIEIQSPGQYYAIIDSFCGGITMFFEVRETSCQVSVHAPNIFNPTPGGNNSIAVFYFDSDVEFEGELYIYDRWGNLVFFDKNNKSSSFDGIFKGKLLQPQVLVWLFKFTPAQDPNNIKIIKGDITIIR